MLIRSGLWRGVCLALGWEAKRSSQVRQVSHRASGKELNFNIKSSFGGDRGGILQLPSSRTKACPEVVSSPSREHSRTAGRCQAQGRARRGLGLFPALRVPPSIQSGIIESVVQTVREEQSLRTNLGKLPGFKITFILIVKSG